MKKSIFLVLLLIFNVNISIYSESEKSTVPEKRKNILWRGDVTSVYPEKAEIKISIFDIPRNTDFESFKKDLLIKKKFSLLQRKSNKKIGNFFIRTVIKEEKINGKYAVNMLGDFQSRSANMRKLISTNVYIAAYEEENPYLDPLRYFENRITSPQKIYLHPKDKKEMVYVEGGFFIFGQGKNASLDNYNPSFYSPSENNLGDVPSFYMDKYEVTNQEYERYLKATNSPSPPHWIDGKFPHGEKDHPVGPLSYREVEGYAIWTGKRLPTEWEWEKAARGIGYVVQKNRDETLSYEIKAMRYPFSDEFDSSLCNTRESNVGKTISVYELPEKGKSPYGITGMCGNISEWTSSWYDIYPNHYLKNKSFGKQYKVIRGGSYYDSARQSTVYYRSFGGNPNLFKDRKAGFRLVIDLKSN